MTGPALPPKKAEPGATIIPFGKHKGSTVAEVLTHDPQYAEWLLGQNWLAEKFAELHAAILARGTGTDDSPEHNMIQARFADPVFRAAVVYCVMGQEEMARAKANARENEVVIRQCRLHNYEQDLVGYRKNLWYFEQPAFQRPSYDSQRRDAEIKIQQAEEALAESRAYAESTPIVVVFGTQAKFEQRGVDVVLRWWFTIADREARHPGSARSFEDTIGIEIKPSLGDDYPATMRQMERLSGPVTTTRDGRVVDPGQRVSVLLIDRFASVVPIDTVRGMFEANDRQLVALREVEAVMAHARALIA